MNIGFTTKDLKKLCRICLRDGEYNLADYKVQLPKDERIQADAALQTEADAIGAHDMLKIFEDCEEATLECGLELELICQKCLDELVPCYVFYRKLKAANIQIQKLCEEAKTNEENVRNNQNEEQVEFLEDYIEEALLEKSPTPKDTTPHVLAHTVAQPKEDSLKEFVEICIASDKVAANSHQKQAEEKKQNTKTTLPPTLRKVFVRQKSRDPKFILTGGVTQLLTHINENIPIIQASKRASTASNMPHKRQRKDWDHKKSVGNASVVVAQFVPAAAQILPSNTTLVENALIAADSLALDTAQDAPSELLTVDYATVEVETQSLNQIAPAWSNAGECTTNTDAVYVCKFCPQAYSAPHYLVAHVRNAHVCKFCTQAFGKTNDLHEHIRREHQSNKCAVCAKELSSRSNLRAHINRVHGIKLPAQMTILDYRPKVDELCEDTETCDYIEQDSEECIEDSTNL